MKVLGVIPARYGSTRFPGKPLVSLQGKPIITWVIEAAQKSKKITDLVVATDDDRIREVAQKSGVQVVMTDSDLASGTDRVFVASKKYSADVIINIQGDEPLIDPHHIDLLAGVYEKETPDMATLAHPLSEADLLSPHAVKVICDIHGMAIYFSRFAIPYSRKSMAETKGPDAALKHIGMYAYSYSFLQKFCETSPAMIEMAESLEQLRALYLGAKIKVVAVESAAPGVDTQEDLKKIESLLASGGPL